MRKKAEKQLQKAHHALEEKVKQRTKSLQEERDLAQNYLDIAAVMMLVIDPNHNVFLINKKGCQILGYDESEILGRNWFENFLPESTRNETLNIFNAMMTGKTRQIDYFENPVLTRNGEERIIAWHNTLMKDHEGNITGSLSSGEDITERRQAEKEREKLQEQLLQSRKMQAIGSMAGGVAHEFNNILAIILGNAELAMDDVPESNPAHECLEEILTSSLRAQKVVQQLLGFAQKSVFQLMPVAVSPLIRETLTLVRASIPTSIEIYQDFSCNKDNRIMADVSQMNLVLLNLCTNAANAMEENGGILEVKLEDITLDERVITHHENLKPGNYVKLTVRDTGTGIKPAIMDRIFDPYFSTRNLAEKTGMGLAVVRGIIQHHNGTITVTSEIGKGSIFEIFLPLIAPAPRSSMPITQA